MDDVAREFFATLSKRGHDPLLEKASGSLRFDLVREKHVERWRVVIDHGDIAVSRGNAPSDATLRTDRALFEGVARGDVNVMAALLRGALYVEGDLELLMLFQRVLPGPRARRKRAPRSRAASRAR